MGNKKRRIVIFLLVVAILVLSLLGVASYKSYIKEKINKQKETEKYQKLNLDDELVIKLFNMTGSNSNQLFANTMYENLYYAKNKVEIKNMPMDFKLLLSYYNIDFNNVELQTNFTSIKEEYIIEQYNKIFGDDNYKPGAIFAGCPSQIKYNTYKKQYEYDEYCGGMQYSGNEHKLIEARKYSDRIEIYNKVVFYLVDENEETVSYWKNSDYSESVITLSYDEKFNIDEHLHDLNIYKYTFKLKGEQYFFEKVEKLK